VLALGLAACLAACGRLGFSNHGDASSADGGVASVFTPVPLQAGGRADWLARGPDSTLYAIFGGFHVASSSDNGASWSDCGPLDNTTAIEELAIDPATGTIYGNGYLEVVASTDHCASWAALGFARPNDGIAIIGGVLVVGSDDGMWQWTGGAWSRYSTPFDGHSIQAIGVSPAAAMNVYATSDAGVERSLDGGVTWAVEDTGITGDLASFLAYDPTDASTVLTQTLSSSGSWRNAYSTDAGASWTNGNDAGYDVALDPAAPSFGLMGSWNYGISASTDGGHGFDSTDHRSPAMHLAAAFEFLYGTSSSVLAATGRGVFGATDHQLAWTEHDGDVDGWVINSVTVGDTGTIFLGTSAGVLVSSDGGSTWNESTTGMITDSETLTVVQKPGDPNTIVAATSGTIAVSKDGGTTFSLPFTCDGSDGWHLHAARLAGGVIVAGTWEDAVTSDATWSTFTHHAVAGGNDVRDVLPLDPAGEHLLASTAVGMYYSTDAGTTWQAENAGLTNLSSWSAIALPDGTLLAATDAGAFRAPGPTGPWTPSGLAAAPVSLFLAAQGHVLAAADNGMFDSTDNGMTWQAMPGLEHAAPESLALDPQRQRLLVGTTGYGLFATPFPPP